MRISVIVPVYNTKHEYLRACLQSLVSQDFEDFEVITVNDGSVNGCDAILREYAEKYGNIVCIDIENQGTSVARNTGLEAAKGEYVMFVDSDDFVSAHCLKTVHEAMKERKTDILFFGYSTNYTNTEVRRVLDDPDPGIWHREDLELAVLRGDSRLGAVEVGAPWGKLIRRSVIDENRVRYTPGLIKGQDTVFILSLLDHCESFSYLPFPGYHYRISGRSISRRFNPDIVSIMEKTLNSYTDFVERRGKGTEYREAVKKKYLNVLLGEYLELYFLHPDNKKPLSTRKEEYRALTVKEPYKGIISEMNIGNAGLFKKAMLSALKKNDIGSVFFLKKGELTLRRIVIHKYD